MKKGKMLLWTAGAAMSVLLLTSCGDYVGKEKTHPLYVKAGTAKNAGEYRDAVKCYEEFLLICPKSAVTHFELGNLYGDNLNEPLKAVYHYRKWLEMNPNDTTNADDVRSFAETAKKNLFKQLCEEYKNDPALQGPSGELTKVKERLNKYMEYAKALNDQNQMMKQRLRAIAEERRGMSAPRRASGVRTAPQPVNTNASEVEPVRKTQPSDSPEKPARGNMEAGKKTVPEVRGNTVANPPRGAFYQVKPGDSLVKISRKHYGSPKYFRLIANANRDKIGKNLQVRVGQTLIIPALPKR